MHAWGDHQQWNGGARDHLSVDIRTREPRQAWLLIPHMASEHDEITSLFLCDSCKSASNLAISEHRVDRKALCSKRSRLQGEPPFCCCSVWPRGWSAQNMKQEETGPKSRRDRLTNR
jgi:hypothetical protein